MTIGAALGSPRSASPPAPISRSDTAVLPSWKGASPTLSNSTELSTKGRPSALPSDSIELSECQLKGVRVETIEMHQFPIEKRAVGSIDFNEDLLTQVFTPYAGRIIGLFAKIGDEVKKGQLLFTIDSPDLLQASSTLISAAAVLQLTTKNLTRLKTSTRRGRFPRRTWSRRSPTSRPPRARCAPPAIRSASSARPTPRWTA